MRRFGNKKAALRGLVGHISRSGEKRSLSLTQGQIQSSKRKIGASAAGFLAPAATNSPDASKDLTCMQQKNVWRHIRDGQRHKSYKFDEVSVHGADELPLGTNMSEGQKPARPMAISRKRIRTSAVMHVEGVESSELKKKAAGPVSRRSENLWPAYSAMRALPKNKPTIARDSLCRVGLTLAEGEPI